MAHRKGTFNIFDAQARNKEHAAQAATAAAPKPKTPAKAKKPAARISTAKTRTPRPIPNDKRKLGSKERSLLG